MTGDDVGAWEETLPEEEVAFVLQAVPEFVARYLELVEDLDDTPAPTAAFAELADYAAELALEVERFRPVLERVMAGVEDVARTSPVAEELVGWGFLDGLSPDDLRRLGPWIGRATRAVLDALELPAPSVPE